MNDPFSGFEALRKNYPGSRRKVGTMAASAEDVAALTGWDEKPYIKSLNGQDVEMFVIGALAKAVNKSVHSIRSYEANGYLPQTPYRLPATVVGGQTRPGRRLYTRPMIEAVIEEFRMRDLLDAPRIEWKHHPDLPQVIADRWRKLQ